MIAAYAELELCGRRAAVGQNRRRAEILLAELEKLLPENGIFSRPMFSPTSPSACCNRRVWEKLMRKTSQKFRGLPAIKRFAERGDGVVEIDVLIICDALT